MSTWDHKRRRGHEGGTVAVMIAGIIMEAGSTPGDGRGKARDVTRSMKSAWIFGRSEDQRTMGINLDYVDVDA